MVCTFKPDNIHVNVKPHTVREGERGVRGRVGRGASQFSNVYRSEEIFNHAIIIILLI